MGLLFVLCLALALSDFAAANISKKLFCSAPPVRPGIGPAFLTEVATTVMTPLKPTQPTKQTPTDVRRYASNLCCGALKAISSSRYSCCMEHAVLRGKRRCCLSGDPVGIGEKCKCTPSTGWIQQGISDVNVRGQTMRQLNETLGIQRRPLHRNNTFHSEMKKDLTFIRNKFRGEDLKNAHNLLKCLHERKRNSTDDAEVVSVEVELKNTGELLSSRDIRKLQEGLNGVSRECWDKINPPKSIWTLITPMTHREATARLDSDIAKADDIISTLTPQLNQIDCIMGPLDSEIQTISHLEDALKLSLAEASTDEKEEHGAESETVEAEGGSFDTVSHTRGAARSVQRGNSSSSTDCDLIHWETHRILHEEYISDARQVIEYIQHTEIKIKDMCSTRWLRDPRTKLPRRK